MSAVLSRGRLLAAMAALALAFALALGVYTSSASAVEKVLVCHATSSETNPFNAIIVDDNSTELEGHLEHEGDFISDVENPEQLTDEEAEAICDAGPPTTTTGEDTTTTTGTGTSTTTTGTGTSTTGTGTSTTGNNTTVNVNTTNTTANTTSTSVTQVTSGNIACVQTAVQQEVNKTQINQFGDNINIQNISQECNINVTQVQNILNFLTINQGGNVVVTTGGTTGGSTSTTGGSTSTTGTTTGGASVQYQYTVPSVQYQYAAETTVLPDTGGSSLLVPAGALLLLAGGGLLAFFVVKRGFAG